MPRVPANFLYAFVGPGGTHEPDSDHAARAARTAPAVLFLADDYDGNFDRIFEDTDFDGRYDMLTVDANRDGRWDAPRPI